MMVQLVIQFKISQNSGPNAFFPENYILRMYEKLTTNLDNHCNEGGKVC